PAPEWPARFVTYRPLGAPRAVERVQEAALDRRVVPVTRQSVVPEPKFVAIGNQQQVPAALRGPVRARFEQQPVAHRCLALEGQQVDGVQDRTGQQHACRSSTGRGCTIGRRRAGTCTRAWGRPPGASSAGQRRRNTKVPLVPPKPKPLETATSTCASRATLGT